MNVESLPKLPPPPADLPGFVRDEWITSQRTSDDQYVNGPGGYNNFVAQAAAFLTTQAMIRAGSLDPKNYVQDRFPMSIPRRPILSFDELGAQLPTVPADPDPSLHMPVLPDWVDTQPAQPGPVFGGTHPPADPATEANRVIDELGKLGKFLMGNFQKLSGQMDAILAEIAKK